MDDGAPQGAVFPIIFRGAWHSRHRLPVGDRSVAPQVSLESVLLGRPYVVGGNLHRLQAPGYRFACEPDLVR